MTGVNDRGRVAAEIGLVAAVATYHVVDHRRIPERLHPFVHAVAAGAVLAAGRRLGLSWDELGLRSDRVGAGTRTGSTHLAPPAVGLMAASTLPWVEDLLADPRAGGLSGAEIGRRALFDIPIGTAVYEEVLFRGVLLGLLRHHTTDRLAVVVSSALFGAWHILPALADRRHNPAAASQPAPITVTATILSTMVAGAWFAHLRLRSGSLVAPILVHGGINVAGLLAATIVDRRRAGMTAVDPRD